MEMPPAAMRTVGITGAIAPQCRVTLPAGAVKVGGGPTAEKLRRTLQRDHYFFSALPLFLSLTQMPIAAPRIANGCRQWAAWFYRLATQGQRARLRRRLLDG